MAGEERIGGPAGIRIRMYRVGFGDFFLLSLQGDGAVAHILIDCGVHAKPTGSIEAAIAQLERDCGGELALIVMTHAHADHISGFATGAATFARMAVGAVWMPWFQNPDDGAAARFGANLLALAQRLQLGLAARDDPADAEWLDMVGNITGDAPGGSAFGLAGSANARALAVLRSGFAAGPGHAPVAYLKAGDAAPLPPALRAIGLRATLLGPPIDPALIAQMDARHHQYLADLAADDAGGPAIPIFAPRYAGSAGDYGDIDPAALAAMTQGVKAAQPDVLRAMAARADSNLNNQSLVILFEYAGKKLLFAGDAQWGNWQGFLFGGALGAPGHTGLTPEARAILASIDFYKVGHHGSTNATPIDALEAMREGVVVMCSTAEDAYGCVEQGSEVPRRPLLAALKAKAHGHLARSDQVAVAGAPAIGEPLDAAFATPTGTLFIDYTF